jgi:hypothetical protein
MPETEEPYTGEWRQGPVRCLSCGAKHVAVRPVITEVMECHHCGELACVEFEGRRTRTRTRR